MGILKEPLNGLLHLIGASLAIPAAIILVVLSWGSPLAVVSFAIYGISLFLLYLFSTLYHWLPARASGKGQVFRKLDHLAIYLLIAGTYTPYSLIVIGGISGWFLFSIIWILAITGIVFQSIYINLPRWLTTTGYLIMGWMVAFHLPALLAKLPPEGLYWLIAGGVVYSLGGVIYVLKKPNFHRLFNFHALWHVFVLGGSICHFISLLYYVLTIARVDWGI